MIKYGKQALLLNIIPRCFPKQLFWRHPISVAPSRQYTDTGEDRFGQFCEADFRRLRRDFLFRQDAENLPVVSGTKPPYILFSHHLRRLVDFTSLDHLGFESHPEILAVYNKALVEHTLTDSQDYTEDLKSRLETEIAAFHNRPACITYSHVTDVKRKLLRALNSNDDVIFYDAANENAQIEMTSCLAEAIPFNHLDINDLKRRLDQYRHKRHKMVLVDSFFPFRGAHIDLKEVSEVAADNECLLVVDDTYGVGTVGETLRGSEECLAETEKPFLLTKSLEYGLGLGIGGYLVGPEALVQHISKLDVIKDDLDLPAPVMAATLAIFRKLKQPETVQTMHEVMATSQHVRQNLTSCGFDVDVGAHPVVSVRVGHESLVNTLADQLQDAGIYCYVAKHPEVPIGQSRLCLSITRHHTSDHIDHALRTLIKTGTRLKIPKEAPPSDKR